MKLLERIKDNFNFNAVDQVYFWKSEWEQFDPQDRLCTVSAGYLIYRFLFASYFITATVYNINCSDLNYYFIFLTNWTFILQLVYSLIYLIRLIWVRFKRREIAARLFTSNTSGFTNEPKLPWPERIIWILINVVSVIPYGVTSIYWLFLFKPANWSEGSTCGNASNILVHALNSVLALLDSGVMAVPIRITHVVFPVIVALAYCFFSGFYEVAGGTYANEEGYIYVILDWKHNPGWAVVSSLGGTIFAAVAHSVTCWGTYRLRILLVNKYFSRDQKPAATVRTSDSHTSVNPNNFAYSNPNLVDGDEVKGGQMGIKITKSLSTTAVPEQDVIGYQVP